MKKKHWAAGGQIKEQKRKKQGRQKGEHYKMYVTTRVEPGPDHLLASLGVPLTQEQSDIAKELGLPKTRVNHELIRRKGGGAA